MKKKQEASAAGLDFDRVEMLEWTAEECEKFEKKTKTKKSKYWL